MAVLGPGRWNRRECSTQHISQLAHHSFRIIGTICSTLVLIICSTADILMIPVQKALFLLLLTWRSEFAWKFWVKQLARQSPRLSRTASQRPLRRSRHRGPTPPGSKCLACEKYGSGSFGRCAHSSGAWSFQKVLSAPSISAAVSVAFASNRD